MNKPQSEEHARIRKAWQDAGLLPADPPRRGTPEQCAAYREAVRDLHLDGLYQQRAGIREETPRYMRLNDRVCELEKPLSPFQRWWHFQRVDAEQELIRLQRASDRQDRATTRGRPR